jgi:uncharacterized protein YuzE
MHSSTAGSSHKAWSNNMIFQYFAETDMLYIKLVDRPSIESEEVAPGVVLDFDEANQVVGIEIENAHNLIDLSRLELLSLPVADLIFSDRVRETV